MYFEILKNVAFPSRLQPVPDGATAENGSTPRSKRGLTGQPPHANSQTCAITSPAEGLSFAAAGKVVRAIPGLAGPGQELGVGDRMSHRRSLVGLNGR
jgi:hypothetical protein